MSQALIRIGVTGSGFMGRTHVEAARRAPGAEIVAVAMSLSPGGVSSGAGLVAVVERSSMTVSVSPSLSHAESATSARRTRITWRSRMRGRGGTEGLDGLPPALGGVGSCGVGVFDSWHLLRGASEPPQQGVQPGTPTAPRAAV